MTPAAMIFKRGKLLGLNRAGNEIKKLPLLPDGFLVPICDFTSTLQAARLLRYCHGVIYRPTVLLLVVADRPTEGCWPGCLINGLQIFGHFLGFNCVALRCVALSDAATKAVHEFSDIFRRLIAVAQKVKTL